MTHTKEPWGHFDGATVFKTTNIKGGARQKNACIAEFRFENTKLNAKRAVECVNALAGIENPAEFVAKSKRDAKELEDFRERVKQLESDRRRLVDMFKGMTKAVYEDGGIFEEYDIKQLITEMEG